MTRPRNMDPYGLTGLHAFPIGLTGIRAYGLTGSQAYGPLRTYGPLRAYGLLRPYGIGLRTYGLAGFHLRSYGLAGHISQSVQSVSQSSPGSPLCPGYISQLVLTGPYGLTGSYGLTGPLRAYGLTGSYGLTGPLRAYGLTGFSLRPSGLTGLRAFIRIHLPGPIE